MSVDISVTSVLKCIKIPIFLLDEDFEILEINPSALKFFNWEYNDSIKKNFFVWCSRTKINPPITKEMLKTAAILFDTKIYIPNTYASTDISSKWDILCSNNIVEGKKIFVIGANISCGKLADLFCRDNYEELITRSMMSLVRHIAMVTKKDSLKEGIVNINQLNFNCHGLSLSEIANLLPGEVYWEDRNLTYLGCNDYCAEVIGLTSNNDLIQQDDLFIKRVMDTNYPDDAYNLWRKTALAVMDKQQAIINMGDLTYNHPDTGEIIASRTSKIPLVDSYGDTVGMVGISINQNNPLHVEQITKVDNMLKDLIKEGIRKSSIANLSAREFECVEARAKGKTIKQIALEQNISPRTVETHLNRAKLKTNSFSSSQLSNLYWDFYGERTGFDTILN